MVHRLFASSLSLSVALLCSCSGGNDAAPPPQTPVCPQPATVASAPANTGVAAPSADAKPVLNGDEGMWLLNDFPSAKVQEKYGFSPDKAWLDNVQKSSVRLAFGCSGSFVSPNGLVMTNHHCAEQCIQQLSSAKKDFIKDGFSAKSEKEEVKCPEIEVNQLTDITDVTERIGAATKGLSDKEYNLAQRAETSKIEKECATSDNVRCDVVNLYHGGRYHLYKYRRYQDVRLAFAPEFGIAFFGGDPDNFNFPRYDLDVTFLRVYDNGKPLAPDHYFKWSANGAKENELTFVSGHPGKTSRQLTIAQLEYERDWALPRRLMGLAQYRGMLTEFMATGKEQKRIASGELFYVENALKALRGRHEALLDKEFFRSKVEAERSLRAKVAAAAELNELAGAWDAIATAQKEKAAIAVRYGMLEGSQGFNSTLFEIARDLLRASDEMKKPNETRLREYADSHVPALKQQLFSTAPLYDEFETLKLGASLVRLREELGADDPLVRKVLGKEEPHELAARLVKTSKLKDLKTRKSLFDGGKAAVDAAKDPMIELARLIDADSRAIRTTYEDHVESVEKKFGEQVAKAAFAAWGTSVYPDATFSLRLSYGHVSGWDEANGTKVPAFTTFGGAFDRATGKSPFELPASWIAAKSKLDPNAPFDFVTTNDITGGNSGSPMINKDAEVVGLIFDGNIHSLGGEYGFDDKTNRAVAVHSSALLTALDRVYGASRIAGELSPKK